MLQLNQEKAEEKKKKKLAANLANEKGGQGKETSQAEAEQARLAEK